MLGDELKKAREKKGLSQRAVAKRAGISQQALSLFERGENIPTIKTLYRLALLLEVPLNQLLKEELSISRKERKQNDT